MANDVVTLNIPMSRDEYEAFRRLKDEFGLTWKELIFCGVQAMKHVGVKKEDFE